MISNGLKLSEIKVESVGGRGSFFEIVTSAITRFENSWNGGSKVSSVTSLFRPPGVFLFVVAFSCKCGLSELHDDACVVKKKCIRQSVSESVSQVVSQVVRQSGSQSVRSSLSQVVSQLVSQSV